MNMDRRRFLFNSAIGAALAAKPAFASGSLAELLLPQGAAPAAKKPAPAPLLDRGFATVTQIADGVYATIADMSKGQQCMSNGGIIAGREAVLILEGHFQPAGAALELEAARSISKSPIRAAVDTHYHFDHVFGNISYAGERIPILAHAQTVTLMKERYAAIQGKPKDSLLAPLEEKLAHAATPELKKHRQGDLDTMKFILSSIDAATLSYPTEALAPKDLPKRMDLGGLTAVIEFHPGHTPADLIVRVPERNVVFTGDLLFNGLYPVCMDADMAAWRKALYEFMAYPRNTVFVPGHGPVCGMEVVREQLAIMAHLRAHAERMIAARATADEAEDQYVIPGRFKDYFVFTWTLTVGAAMRNYYATLPHPS